MKKLLNVLSLVPLLLSLSGEAKVIYGEDSRIEVYEGTPFQQNLAKAAAVLILKKDVYQASDRVEINQRSFNQWIKDQTSAQDKKSIGILSSLARVSVNKKEIPFCPTVRFTDQPNAGDCSGFLIGPDLLMTAGHCALKENFCSDFHWVFDFVVDESTGRAGTDLTNDSIYSCKQVVSQTLTMSLSLDYAIVKLDRPVTGRVPLKIRNDQKIQDKTSLLMIGSPSGLPLKISSGAKIRDNSHPYFFSTNLDSFEGNSGSAVFNSATGIVEGILVRGEEDYQYNRLRRCLEPNICNDAGCRGEDVTRLTAVPEVGIQVALNRAALQGDMKVLNGLLKLKTWVDFYGHDGVTALMNAAKGGSHAAVRALIQAGASVDLQDVNGNSALHHLAGVLNSKNEAAVRELIQAKANLELQNKNGESPLKVAVKRQNTEGVKILLRYGARP